MQSETTRLVNSTDDIPTSSNLASALPNVPHSIPKVYNKSKENKLTSSTQVNLSNMYLNNFEDDAEFEEIIHEVERAIANDVLPERIYQGSSGSYFAKNTKGEIVGVFKPKDEEPYGKLNPKWTKFIQKICCPCCFGRAFLVLNQGYLSEAGASLLDERFGLNIVPKTKIVCLSSETFNYSRIDRLNVRAKKQLTDRFPDTMGRRIKRPGLKPKVGSFQLFVKGFKEAEYWIREFENEPLPQKTQDEFQFLFEKLVVLDYISRNTDRGNDNWLVKVERPEVSASDVVDPETAEWDLVEVPDIKIAAIDNGLSFPFKHPDEWRGYPYHWAWLEIAKKPFSQRIKDLVEHKLSDEVFIDNLMHDLHNLFKTDKGFDESTFEKQMAVLRGQVLNLMYSMRANESPSELAQRHVLALERINDPGIDNSALSCDGQPPEPVSDAMNNNLNTSNNNQRFSARYQRRPFFSWC